MTRGEQIKAARKKAGITQAELASRLGISFQGVAQWENDLRTPKIETLQKIADALGFGFLIKKDGEIEFYEFQDTPQGEPRNLEALKNWVSSKEKARLDKAFGKLNATGQQKAVERVEELAKIPDYQKE